MSRLVHLPSLETDDIVWGRLIQLHLQPKSQASLIFRDIQSTCPPSGTKCPDFDKAALDIVGNSKLASRSFPGKVLLRGESHGSTHRPGSTGEGGATTHAVPVASSARNWLKFLTGIRYRALLVERFLRKSGD